jgi:hypothetical protein
MYRLVILMLGGLALSACESSLPRSDAMAQAQPAPYRIGPDGLRIDNAGFRLDSEGYRIDNRGNRVGLVPPSQDDPSNAVAGYYVAP